MPLTTMSSENEYISRRLYSSIERLGWRKGLGEGRGVLAHTVVRREESELVRFGFLIVVFVQDDETVFKDKGEGRRLKVFIRFS